jgi:DNA-binding NtrC family response regulator
MSQPLIFPSDFQLRCESRREGRTQTNRFADVSKRPSIFRGSPRVPQDVPTTVLREENANQVRAAKRLGIHRNTLRRKIHELELDIKTFQGMRRRPPLSERALVERKRARTTR